MIDIVLALIDYYNRLAAGMTNNEKRTRASNTRVFAMITVVIAPSSTDTFFYPILRASTTHIVKPRRTYALAKNTTRDSSTITAEINHNTFINGSTLHAIQTGSIQKNTTH